MMCLFFIISKWIEYHLVFVLSDIIVCILVFKIYELHVRRQNQYKDINSITHGHKNDQKLQDFHICKQSKELRQFTI